MGKVQSDIIKKEVMFFSCMGIGKNQFPVWGFIALNLFKSENMSSYIDTSVEDKANRKIINQII